MTNTADESSVDEWGIVELFGHIRLAGRISEVERYGGKMLRLDIPDNNGGFVATQLIGHAAIYRITPCTEVTARRAAALSRPAPVQRWELPPGPAPELPDPEGLVDADVDAPF